MASVNTHRGAKRGRQARARLGIDPAAPIVCIVDVVETLLGIPVLVAAMREGDAGCIWQDGEDRLIVVNGDDAIPRQRFTVAHELGHVECNHVDAEVTIDTTETMFGPGRPPHEVQANAFAAEFLVPAVAVREAITTDPDIDALLDIAAGFGVSAQAALYRCSTLRLISQARYDELDAVIKAGDHRERWTERGLTGPQDAFGAMGEERVRVPAAIEQSALAGVIRGEVSVRSAAHAAGVDELALATIIEQLGLA